MPINYNISILKFLCLIFNLEIIFLLYNIIYYNDELYYILLLQSFNIMIVGINLYNLLYVYLNKNTNIYLSYKYKNIIDCSIVIFWMGFNIYRSYNILKLINIIVSNSLILYLLLNIKNISNSTNIDKKKMIQMYSELNLIIKNYKNNSNLSNTEVSKIADMCLYLKEFTNKIKKNKETNKIINNIPKHT